MIDSFFKILSQLKYGLSPGITLTKFEKFQQLNLIRNWKTARKNVTLNCSFFFSSALLKRQIFQRVSINDQILYRSIKFVSQNLYMNSIYILLFESSEFNLFAGFVPPTCHICGNPFTMNTHLADHLLSVHRGKQKWICAHWWWNVSDHCLLQCKFCNQTFQEKGDHDCFHSGFSLIRQARAILFLTYKYI